MGFADFLDTRNFVVLASLEELFHGLAPDHEVDVFGLGIGERHGHTRNGVDLPNTKNIRKNNHNSIYGAISVSSHLRIFG